MYLELRTEVQFREFFAEFGATEESVRRDVHHLIEWMEKQPHLPNVKGEYREMRPLLYLFPADSFMSSEKIERLKTAKEFHRG